MYHGKYESCRDNSSVLKYCTKEGKYISSYSEEEIKAISSSRKKKSSMLGELII